ncbi:MAG: response regulator [Oscillospiraceae bacterium]|nr:response regulator [Oscillospiraceae bacterium]
MFKLVIVEDEDNIRHSLECFIPWNQMGFEVVATFSDGSDALAYLKDNPCDAVMTDVLMSRMSGLDMIRQLHTIHPQIKVVILSGYSEFSYAQEAIRYQVVHYLVKPVDVDELMEVFTNIAEQLQQEKQDASVEETVAETDPLLNAELSTIPEYKLLIMELDLHSRETLNRVLNRIVSDRQGFSVEELRTALAGLYSATALCYQKRKTDVAAITDGRFTADHLYSTDSPAKLTACIIEDFGILCDALKTGGYKSRHGVIERVAQDLQENIAEDVGHDVLGQKYRLHPGYLSRLFKQEMGETLSDYMLRIRIEKSARLLKEGHHKIGEIAGLVGYSTPSYFSIMFKKYTGYSPREYCQKVLL